MKHPKLKQPKEIRKGDLVIIVDEEPSFVCFINEFFVIGDIIKDNHEGRNYQLLSLSNQNAIEIDNSYYWTRREYLNVVSREDKGKTIEYDHMQNEQDKDSWFLEWGWE